MTHKLYHALKSTKGKFNEREIKIKIKIHWRHILVKSSLLSILVPIQFIAKEPTNIILMLEQHHHINYWKGLLITSLTFSIQTNRIQHVLPNLSAPKKKKKKKSKIVASQLKGTVENQAEHSNLTSKFNIDNDTEKGKKIYKDELFSFSWIIKYELLRLKRS